MQASKRLLSARQRGTSVAEERLASLHPLASNNAMCVGYKSLHACRAVRFCAGRCAGRCAETSLRPGAGHSSRTWTGSIGRCRNLHYPVSDSRALGCRPTPESWKSGFRMVHRDTEMVPPCTTCG